MDALPTSLRAHLASLRVAVYGSGGAPSHHLALLAHWGTTPYVVYAEDILAGRLGDYDAVIFPGGGLAAMAGQLNPLGVAGMTALREWVTAGGSYIGSCAGSCHPLRMSDAYVAAYPEAAPFQVCDVTPLNAAAGAWGLESPGTGRIRVEPEDHPLFRGLAEPFDIVHYNGPLFPDVAGAAGRVTAPTDAFTPFEASEGKNPQTTTLARGIASGARVAYLQRVEEGQVILFGSHPEFGSSALQLGFLPAARLLANALGLVEGRLQTVPEPDLLPLGADLLAALQSGVAHLEHLLEAAASLGARLPPETPGFLGMPGRDLWDAALAEAHGLLVEVGRWLEHELKRCPAGTLVRGLHLLDTDPKPGQDVGFMGVRQGLEQASILTRSALVAPWTPFTGAYNELATHPYHLLVSSYLSACGLVAAMFLQVSAFAALNALPLPRHTKESFYAEQVL